ncbi:neurofilament heavy protein [Trema orientale]|uniref:Neurofilament heavy protein n=1 Tax=Trema orientale TaxID=63057 RepID=A0A2P5ECY2_TREOI|nr:neurofilament heavy protein [Trema orientale]
MEEESQLMSHINGEDGAGGDEFYEKIEAPKFVDFTLPDHYSPDDRYWFCLRVGCDQKHEEELDPEAINKNFILRVMAARSPNIRLRKALNRKPLSSSPKCPLTAPPKSSKPRISRLAVISSISRKIIYAKDKTRPISKLTATPKANLKKSSAATKAFTTPRNRKRSSNPDTFKSVRNAKATNIVVPKTRVIAKALVFHSPKKACRTKTSLELKTPVGKLCAAMSKLEIASAKKQTIGCNRPLPSDRTSRKQFRGREVKSRVYDSLYSHSHKDQEAKPLKNIKRRRKEKDLKQSCGPVSHEDDENDSSDMEIDHRSRDGSLEGCSESGTSKNGETNGREVSLNFKESSEPPSEEHPVEAFSETSKGDISTLSSSEERAPGDSDYQNSLDVTEPVRKTNDASEEKRNSPQDIDNDDKENALPYDNTGNDGEVIDNDEKENSASDENRETDNHSEGKFVSNHDTKKATHVTKKTLKMSSVPSTGAQEAKYKKPKPTNPKPFRLRTDERGILKEANLEKKQATPLKELTSVRPSGIKSLRKHQNLNQKKESCQEQSESESVNRGDSEKRMNRTRSSQPGSTRTPRTCPVSMNHKAQAEAVTTSEKSSERTKPQIMRKSSVRPQGIASSRKAVRTPGRLGVIKEKSSTFLRDKEATKPCENGASSATKASGSTAPRSVSRGRRPATIPKEPNFHSIHVPKSCTRKVA